MHTLRVLFSAFYIVCLAGAPATSQSSAAVDQEGRAPFIYRLSFPDRAHHLAEIEAVFQDLAPGTLEVRMSRTSPGRYALHEFAKNIQDVRITNNLGTALSFDRPDPHQWTITHQGTVRFRYRLYGDRTDGTYTAIDRSHAHLNIPATLVWVRGHDNRRIEVHVDAPDGWRIATQLPPVGDDPLVREAPDLAILMDSPIEISEHRLYAFEVASFGPTQTIEVALHHAGDENHAEAWVARVERIVLETAAIFGELPAFDYGRYTFLADYLPAASGDGMEHRNSTILTSSSGLEENSLGLLGTVAHEFVHAWNIERLRPRSLEPFDFEDADMSDALWFGEGFTSYLDDLILKRAGILNLDQFAGRLGRTIDAIENSSGPDHRSPVEMSRRAPFVDAATWVDPTSFSNTFLSYYTWGAGLGAALDLELRRDHDSSLDAYLQKLWRDFGANEEPYELTDLEGALAALVSNPRWANQWFERHVYGQERPNWPALLAPAGMTLRKAKPSGAWIGTSGIGAPQLMCKPEGCQLTSSPRKGSPLWTAGLDRGDTLVALEGAALGSKNDVQEAVATLTPETTAMAIVRWRHEERKPPGRPGSPGRPSPRGRAVGTPGREGHRRSSSFSSGMASHSRTSSEAPTALLPNWHTQLPRRHQLLPHSRRQAHHRPPNKAVRPAAPRTRDRSSKSAQRDRHGEFRRADHRPESKEQVHRRHESAARDGTTKSKIATAGRPPEKGGPRNGPLAPQM